MSTAAPHVEPQAESHGLFASLPDFRIEPRPAREIDADNNDRVAPPQVDLLAPKANQEPDPLVFYLVERPAASPYAQRLYRDSANGVTINVFRRREDPLAEPEKGLEVELRTVEELGDRLQHSNPTQHKANCANVAYSVDRTMSGAPTSAMNRMFDNREVDLILEHNHQFCSKYMVGGTVEDVAEQMGRMGPGSRGLLLLIHGQSFSRPEGAGHVQNVANIDGAIYFIDGQDGDGGPLSDFNRFCLIPTTDARGVSTHREVLPQDMPRHGETIDEAEVEKVLEEMELVEPFPDHLA